MLRLTEEQKQQYEQHGYLLGMPPIFNEEEVKGLMSGYEKLAELLLEDEGPSDMSQWHRTSRFLYDISAHPQILNYVEDILGPNFYLWASEFITKAPRTDKTVPWHQDAHYWPLTPHNTVTVWLAFGDVDEENGAMKVIPGTHKGGLIKHRIADETSILSFELEDGTFSEQDAISLKIPAGGISLHDDAIIHGSPANHSDRWRIALVLRYSSTDVKCDLSVVPTFQAYLMRGVDAYRHHPEGEVPTERYARPEHTTKRIRKTL